MRILFVAMPDSIHSARWINQVTDKIGDVHFFPTHDAPLHPNFRNITAWRLPVFRYRGLDPSVRLRGIWPLPKAGGRLGLEIERYFPRWGRRAARLAMLVRWLKPDMVHSLEIQQAGYLTQAAKARGKGHFAPWIVSNWGSDIYLFGRLAEHRERIKAVMASCDYYTAECERDIALGRSFGFTGKTLPVLPAAGGYDLDYMRQFRQPGPTSARRTIALKGQLGWPGRALVGLRALELCANFLRDGEYRVEIYSASSEVKMAAELFSQATGVPVSVTDREPREDVLRMHGRARASIKLGIGDGISTSALEAIVLGAFPIQSNTSCFDEWVRHGETGMLLHPEDPQEVAAAIRRVVTDDVLVDRAIEANDRTVAERLDKAVIQPQAIAMYERVVAEAHGKKGAVAQ